MKKSMEKENSSTLLKEAKKYINIPLWVQEDDESTYYDRKLDLQGKVPGSSFEEAKKAFEKKYHVKL